MSNVPESDGADVVDLHFTMGEPVMIGEPMMGRDGSVIGTVISCTDDCAEAFHVVVRPTHRV